MCLSIMFLYQTGEFLPRFPLDILLYRKGEEEWKYPPPFFSKKVAKVMKEVLEEKRARINSFPLPPPQRVAIFIRRWLFLSARAPDAHLLPRKEKERKIFNIFF